VSGRPGDYTTARLYRAGMFLTKLRSHPDLQHPDDQRDLTAALHAVDVLYRFGDLFAPDPYIDRDDIDRRFREQIEGEGTP
jgi:hypothetical protein